MLYNRIEENKRKTFIYLFFYGILLGIITFILYKIYPDPMILSLMFIFALFSTFIGWFWGDSMILKSNNANEIKKKDAPQLYRIVENLAITAGIPTPKIYIINDDSINAFATGRDPEHASIALTSGAIKKLDKNEISGVIAHELSHIKNYDIRLQLIIIAIIAFILNLLNIASRFLYLGSRKNRKSSPLDLIALIAFIILIIFTPIITKLIQLAISRQREFLADADAALLTRYPEGLASALEKIKNENQKMQKINPLSQSLYIANPLKPAIKKENSLFLSHPPIDERIKRLRSFNF